MINVREHTPLDVFHSQKILTSKATLQMRVAYEAAAAGEPLDRTGEVQETREHLRDLLDAARKERLFLFKTVPALELLFNKTLVEALIDIEDYLDLMENFIHYNYKFPRSGNQSDVGYRKGGEVSTAQLLKILTEFDEDIELTVDKNEYMRIRYAVLDACKHIRGYQKVNFDIESYTQEDPIIKWVAILEVLNNYANEIPEELLEKSILNTSSDILKLVNKVKRVEGDKE